MNANNNLPPGCLLRDIDPTDPSSIEDFLSSANQRAQWRLAYADEKAEMKADIEREDSV